MQDAGGHAVVGLASRLVASWEAVTLRGWGWKVSRLPLGSLGLPPDFPKAQPQGSHLSSALAHSVTLGKSQPVSEP